MTGIVTGLLLLTFVASIVLMSDRPVSADDVRYSSFFSAVGTVLLFWGLLARRRGSVAEPIRWFSVRGAAEDAEQGRIGASAQIQYLATFLAIELFAWGADTMMYSFAWEDNRSNSDFVAIPLFVIKIIGPVLAYFSNGGRRGRDFLLRFFALSFPICWRLLAAELLAIPLIWLAATFAEARFSIPHQPAFRGLGAGIFWLLFNLGHYSVLCIVLGKLRKQPREMGANCDNAGVA